MFSSKPPSPQKLANRMLRAIKNGKLEDLRALLATEGANVNMHDNDNYDYPMDYVIKCRYSYYECYPEMLRMLMDAGGIVRSGSFQVACALGRIDIVKTLLPVMTDLNANDGYGSGNTALHEAAINGQGDIVQLLLAAGADPNVQNMHMNTAADVCKASNPKISDFIRCHPAYRNTEQDSEWKVTGSREISHVCEKKELGLILTEIFNFETRSYLNIVFNVTANTQSQAMKSFNEIEDTHLVTQAAGELASRTHQAMDDIMSNPGFKKRFKPNEI